MTAPASPATRASSPAWLTLTLSVIFGLLFAYDVWEAVGNFVGVNVVASGLETTITPVGWVVLILGILLPIAVFALAYWLGRRRNSLAQALLYLAGLGTVAAVSLSSLALFRLGSVLT
jgi:ABC-type transport system involved in cytochrome c biogenesis permease subunit